MTALAPEVPALARSLLALAAVIALVAAARWLMPRAGTARCSGEPLVLAASLALDARSRIVIVRRGAAELVLAIGPNGVTRLELPATASGAGSAAP